MPFTQEQIRRYNEQYHPCETGVHVCGLRDGAEFGPHVTEVNLPPVPLAMFENIKAEYDEADSNDYEVIVDLMEGGSCIDNFGVKRQMLDRILRDLSGPPL